MKTSIQIDMVSDVVCPWCAVGLHSLLQALEDFDELDCELRFQPFELSPEMGSEGEEVIPHLCQKYGISADEVKANQARITARGAELGFRFDFRSDSKKWNTFDAHRLLNWAQQQPGGSAVVQTRQRNLAPQPGTVLALKQALLTASFTENRNLADRDELAMIAGEAGFDTQVARAFLDSDSLIADVRAEEKRWQELGITSVPAFIFEGKYLVSGAQPQEQLRSVIEKLLAEG